MKYQIIVILKMNFKIFKQKKMEVILNIVFLLLFYYYIEIKKVQCNEKCYKIIHLYLYMKF